MFLSQDAGLKKMIFDMRLIQMLPEADVMFKNQLRRILVKLSEAGLKSFV